MTNTKPEVRIDIDANGTSCLPALSALTDLRPERSFHDSRHPLGIYNVSLNRIFDKIRKCCEKLESYWSASESVSELRKHHTPLRREVIDYLARKMHERA